MNKSLLLASAFMLGGTTFAQITVTEANVAGPTDMVIQNFDTIPTISAPSAGANQTWDYSTGLVAHEEDTITFSAPQWLANAASFPTANLAAVDGDGLEIYFINDATSLRMLGIAGDLFGTGTIAITNDPANELIRFPANFNDSYTTNALQSISIDGATVGLPVDSVVSKTYSAKDVNIDAWGSLTTPYGTFEVLRQSEMTIETDSSWSYVFGVETLVDNSVDTSYNYVFWSNDPSTDFPVMEMSHDNAGTVLSVSWLKEAPSAGISPIEIANIKMYPNPVSEVLSVEIPTNKAAAIYLYNMQGAVVASTSVDSEITTINVSELENGTYIMKAVNSLDEIIYSNEIIVSK